MFKIGNVLKSAVTLALLCLFVESSSGNDDGDKPSGDLRFSDGEILRLFEDSKRQQPKLYGSGWRRKRSTETAQKRDREDQAYHDYLRKMREGMLKSDAPWKRDAEDDAYKAYLKNIRREMITSKGAPWKRGDAEDKAYQAWLTETRAKMRNSKGAPWKRDGEKNAYQRWLKSEQNRMRSPSNAWSRFRPKKDDLPAEFHQNFLMYDTNPSYQRLAEYNGKLHDSGSYRFEFKRKHSTMSEEEFRKRYQDFMSTLGGDDGNNRDVNSKSKV